MTPGREIKNMFKLKEILSHKSMKVVENYLHTEAKKKNEREAEKSLSYKKLNATEKYLRL